ncbi:MAG: cell division protein FtsA [Cuspidothrix sp.]
MNQRLTQEQLNQIIVEVQGLQLRQEAEFDQKQIHEILQELNLPPELLDEALIQLRRRQALEVQQRRNKMILAGVVAAVILTVGGFFFVNQRQNSLLTNISVQQDKITLADNRNLQTIDRQSNPEIFYRVTLKDAPIGQKLSLTCNWIDPRAVSF